MKQKIEYLKVKLALGSVSLVAGLLAANLVLFNWMEQTNLHYALGNYARYACAYGGFAAMIFGAMLINDFLIFRNAEVIKYIEDSMSEPELNVFFNFEKDEEKEIIAQ